MKVREIMTPDVVTVDQRDPIARAEELMQLNRIRHVPVVDGDVLVGVVTQRDVLAFSLPPGSDPIDDQDLKSRTRVQRIMRGAVETVRPDADVAEAADKMLALKIGSVAVVDERLHLVGIVTEADFVRLARALLGAIEPAVEELARARRAG